jgi:hypothetical protein
LQTQIKMLQAAAMVSQKSECEQPASHIFRGGTVAAYCESHAKQEADRIGIDLPLTMATGSLPTDLLAARRLRGTARLDRKVFVFERA